MTRNRPLLLDQLDDDWSTVVRTTVATDRLHSWGEHRPVLARPKSLPELLAAIQTGTVEDSSDLMWELLDVARDDDFAVRVLLQVIVPGLGSDARLLAWWSRRLGGDLVEGDHEQLLLAAALEAIHNAIGTRRKWPVASILRRVHRIVAREMRNEERWHQRVSLDERLITDGPSPDVDESESDDLVDLLRAATRRGSLSASDVELMWMIGVGGYDLHELEGHFGASYSCLRQRRYRAECRLAELREAV